MRRTVLVLATFCLIPAGAVYSQNDFSSNGTAGQQSQRARQAFGQQPGGGAANAPANAAAGNDPAYMQQVSYGLGRKFAMNLRDNDIQVDFQALMAGISDTLRGAQPKWNDQQLGAALERFGNEFQQKQMAQMRQVAAKNQQEAAQFLAQNSKRPGVQSTASGLQYRVLQQGNGPSPTLNDTVRCNYRGTLLNGTEFDSSTRQGGPAEFAVKDVIPGWTEALQKMHVGDKWQLFVPAKLAYDMHPPRPPIEPGSTLVFEIELLGIVQK
ncbi:MAG TPA: FKBP-type peptidyl-prolyl cis-trans isomerase [Lacipirellulaceae bacterium]|nr:FKBP-type peptidyl-prolyl cis-trans isomerase [Lacipirellulaceae bacterium]